MLKGSNIPLSDSITIQILKITCAIYFIITVTVTLIHMKAEYQHIKQEIIQSMEAMQATFEPVLTQALWRMDRRQWESTINGMMKSPVLVGVKLEVKKELLFASGMILDEKGKIVSGDLAGDSSILNVKSSYSNLFQHHFVLNYAKEQVGEITLYSGSNIVFQKVKVGFAFIILNAIIKTIALWFLFIWAGYRVLNRPLSTLTAAVEKFNLKNLENFKIDIKTSKRNELKVLEEAFNSMIKKLVIAETERKQGEVELRKSEERFRNLFENSPVSLWEEDFSGVKSYLQSLEDEIGTDFEQYLADHPEVLTRCAALVKILDINRASLELHGANTKKELLENLATTFTLESYQAFKKEIVAILEGRDQVKTDAVVQTLDGIPRHVSLRWQISPGYEETLSNVLVSLTDISQRKKAEDRLAAVNLRLEELVDKRTRALEKTTEEARAANRAKSEFLARMSHEIRTPMNGIIGLTNLVLKSELTFQQENYLKKVHESSDHLLNVINDILDFSRIEEGKIEIEKRDFMLNHVISQVSDITGERAARKQVEMFYIIDKALPLSLTGDSLRLNQILINLIGNAIKFTERGEIVFRVQVTEKPVSGNKVELLFSVRDTGIGISPEQIETLFRPFIQADGSMTRKYGGTGLGLSISQQLVNLMGGQIWAESVEGQGSVFYFTLPFALQPEEKRRVLLAPEDAKGLKVMVADDNETARIIFKDMLEAFDSFQVTVTDSGKKALDKMKRALSEKPYNLLILDWKMPDMDGFEVARQLKSDPMFMKPGAMPKIIMVTMYGREDVFQRAKAEKTGIDVFLRKPVSSSKMFNAVMQALGQEDALAPRQKSATEKISSEALAGIKTARILLAEDNEINQNVAVALLEEAGLITEVAENGRKAVEMVKTSVSEAKRMYDAVLMDIEMPEIDGYDAARIIRNIPGCEDLPVIAMTAHAMKGDREKCLDAGMNDYLPKPIDEQRLYALLCKWIKPGKREIPAEFAQRKKQTPASEAALPDALPGIDIKAALKRAGGDAGLMRMMLMSFLEKYEHAAGQIEKLLYAGKFRDAHNVTHTIKGVSGNLCADALFIAARELDDALKQEKIEEARSLLAVFARRLAQFTDGLKILNPVNESADTGYKDKNGDEAFDLSEAEGILTEMIALLEKNRLNGWHLLEPLLSLLPNSEFRDEKVALKKAMSALDTEGGIAVMLKLGQKLGILQFSVNSLTEC